jgi:hypothetical protein
VNCVNTAEIPALKWRRNFRILFEDANNVETIQRNPRSQEFSGGFEENVTDAESDENSTRYLAFVGREWANVQGVLRKYAKHILPGTGEIAVFE